MRWKIPEHSKKKKLLFLVCLCVILAVLCFSVIQLMKSQPSESEDWIPVNLSLEVALSDNELALNADLTLEQDTTTEMMSEEPVILDINKADAFELELLPGIGPAKAKAIVDHRQKNGRFQTTEDLLEVSGIGPATFEKLKEYILVD